MFGQFFRSYKEIINYNAKRKFHFGVKISDDLKIFIGYLNDIHSTIKFTKFTLFY